MFKIQCSALGIYVVKKFEGAVALKKALKILIYKGFNA